MLKMILIAKIVLHHPNIFEQDEICKAIEDGGYILAPSGYKGEMMIYKSN